ncbi:L37A2 protein, partial [Turnix velox]|nr:L37A2 protein [Turnix velox]
IQNDSDNVEQAKKTPGMEDVEDAEEAPPPRQDYIWTSRRQEQEDSLYLSKRHQLFYETFGNLKPEEEPTLMESEAEQRRNTNQQFFDNTLVNNHLPTANSTLEAKAEGEGSSLGGHSPTIPPAAETHWPQEKEGSGFLNKTSNSDSLDYTQAQGDLFETKVNHQLHWLIPNKALRTFIAQVARALRMDCHQPELQPACAELVSQTGVLIKLLSEGQDDQGASAVMGQCLLEGNITNGSTSETDRKVGETLGIVGCVLLDKGEWREQGSLPASSSLLCSQLRAEHTLGDGFLLSLLVSLVIMIFLTVICLLEV